MDGIVERALKPKTKRLLPYKITRVMYNDAKRDIKYVILETWKKKNSVR